MLCGGLTPGLKPITPEVQALANKHWGEAQTRLGRTFQTWNAVGFSTQVVAGVNYWIKIQSDNGEFVHIKVYQPLGNAESQLTEAQGNKTQDQAFH